MSRIRDNIRDCAVYLYPSVEAAENGIMAGGSGFLVGIPSKTDKTLFYSYVVANRRTVVEGATVVRVNTHGGKTDIVNLSANDWLLHPDGDDLAVARIILKSDCHDYMLINELEMFLSEEWLRKMRIGLGDELFLVGRLIDHERRQRNSQIVRCGHLAMMPAELEQVGQEYFLADIPPIGNMCGSPVFVTIHRLRLPNPLDFNHEWLPYLLGVHCGIHAQTGLMKVLPAWRLAQLIDQPRFLQARIEEDSRRHAGASRVRSKR